MSIENNLILAYTKTKPSYCQPVQMFKGPQGKQFVHSVSTTNMVNERFKNEGLLCAILTTLQICNL